MNRRRRRRLLRITGRLGGLVVVLLGLLWAVGELAQGSRVHGHLAGVRAPLAPPIVRFGSQAAQAEWKLDLDVRGPETGALPPPRIITARAVDTGTGESDPSAKGQLSVEPGHGHDHSPFLAADAREGPYLWEAPGTLNTPSTEAAVTRLEANPPIRTDGVARVVIVIDDLGHSPALARQTMQLPDKVTLAFLPYSPSTPELAREAMRSGHEVIVHLPMEPGGDADPGPNALLLDLTSSEIRRRVDWALSRVPGAVGVNNHMGSRFTSDPVSIGLVLERLRERRLFFVDSLTSPSSAAGSTAKAMGIPSTIRDIFIDHEPTRRAIDKQLARIERLALSTGSAVAIGHPGPDTLAALRAWMPEARRRGIVFTQLGEIIARRHCGRAEGQCDPERYLAQALGLEDGAARP